MELVYLRGRKGQEERVKKRGDREEGIEQQRRVDVLGHVCNLLKKPILTLALKEIPRLLNKSKQMLTTMQVNSKIQ